MDKKGLKKLIMAAFCLGAIGFAGYVAINKGVFQKAFSQEDQPANWQEISKFVGEKHAEYKVEQVKRRLTFP